jgi:hypothetical protein
MIDPLRLADALTKQADDYGTKATASPGARDMYGTASLVLYALSIAILEAIQPVLAAQQEHDDAP